MVFLIFTPGLTPVTDAQLGYQSTWSLNVIADNTFIIVPVRIL